MLLEGESMNTTAVAAIVIAAVAIVLVIIGAWFLIHKRRSGTLQTQFGPEYDEAVRNYGSRAKAEDALLARRKRMEQIEIRRLQPEERDQFADRWHALQTEFVDNPLRAIQDADRLVLQLMVARGYPMADFDRRAEDLSVDHPHVVRNYRAAHEVALRREQATTEDLRRGLVHYRDLFDELLEAHTAGPRGRI
jgi:hypothetical protein